MAVDHGSDTTAQPRLWRQGHLPVAAPTRRRRCAHGRAQHGTTAVSGLRWPSNRCKAEETTTSTAKHRRSSSKLARVDQASRARSTGAELGGDGGDGRRCRQNPAVGRKRATRRSRIAIGRRRISPELAGAGRGVRR
jgi:hypothetical protein